MLKMSVMFGKILAMLFNIHLQMLMNAGNGVIIVSTHHRMEHVEILLAHSYVAATLDILEMVLRRAKVPH
jgi:hypothetical protein